MKGFSAWLCVFSVLILCLASASIVLPFHIQEPRIDESAKVQAEESFRKFRDEEHGREFEAAEKAARNLKELEGVSPEMLSDVFQGKQTGKAPAADAHPKFAHDYALFISSSIPVSTLREYVSQINSLSQENIHVTMYLRGFVDGMHRMGPTISFYFSLAMKDQAGPVTSENQRPTGFLIDPESFQKFHVTSVPALVDLKTGCIVLGDATLQKLIDDLEDNRCREKAGSIFEIAEQDPLNEIRKAVAGISWDQVKKRLHNKLNASLENNCSSIDLPPASKDTSRLLEFSATLPFDVLDPETNEVLYPEGFTFHPLDYVSPQGSLIIFNGSIDAEILWLKSQLEQDTFTSPVRIASTAGNIRNLSSHLQTPVFSAVSIAAKATEKGWCRATPCVISFRDGKILAREFAVATGSMP